MKYRTRLHEVPSPAWRKIEAPAAHKAAEMLLAQLEDEGADLPIPVFVEVVPETGAPLRFQGDYGGTGWACSVLKKWAAGSWNLKGAEGPL